MIMIGELTMMSNGKALSQFFYINIVYFYFVRLDYFNVGFILYDNSNMHLNHLLRMFI